MRYLMKTMKSINLRKVTYAYGERSILKEVSLQCSENERLCILGENGAGKSTLLKIIAGKIGVTAGKAREAVEADGGDFDTEEAEKEADIMRAEAQMSGTVEQNGHVRTIYVAQEFPAAFKEANVETYIDKQIGIALSRKVYGIARELGFDIEKLASQKCGSFSGGQQKILALATAFASNPDILLLDEPENHIDIVSRVVLIRMLSEYRGGVIFISHDRLIIDSVATKVAEVANGDIHVSEGGYDDYIEEKMARIGGMQRVFDTETKRIKQLESTIVILRQKAIRGKEISAFQRKKAELDELKKAHKENGRPDDKKAKIRIGQGGQALHDGKLLCRIKNATFKYEGAKANIFNDVTLEVRTGSHIALLGRNGSGKSTFLKCLIGEFPVQSGEVVWARVSTPDAKDSDRQVKFAYFDQHMQFEPNEKPIDVVMKKLNCFDVEARAALGAVRFDLPKMNTRIGDLSGGERMRLRFALVFGQKPDFLILDEPTNHIDEVTWEVLLGACKASTSTILLVSHDYEFIQEFAPEIFWVINGQQVNARYRDLSELLDEMGGTASPRVELS